MRVYTMIHDLFENELLKRGNIWIAEQQDPLSPTATPPAGSSLQGTPTEHSPLAQLFPPSGIRPGTTHEWIATHHAQLPKGASTAQANLPATIPTVFAHEVLKPAVAGKKALWIGRNAWPAPFLLERLTGAAFNHCLFIDPPNEQELLWSVDTALRSPAVAVVVTTIPKLTLPLSRRFSINARESAAVGFLLSPKASRLPLATNSAWVLAPLPSASERSCWHLSLQRIKGVQPQHTEWTLEVDDETVSFTVSPQLAQRGVTAGMPEILARARCPELVCAPFDCGAEYRALYRLAHRNETPMDSCIYPGTLVSIELAWVFQTPVFAPKRTSWNSVLRIIGGIAARGSGRLPVLLGGGG